MRREIFQIKNLLLINCYYIQKILFLIILVFLNCASYVRYMSIALPPSIGASRENGERHTRAEPERGESEEQLSRADGITTRTREDTSVLHGGT